jgi:hypothetical protein
VQTCLLPPACHSTLLLSAGSSRLVGTHSFINPLIHPKYVLSQALVTKDVLMSKRQSVTGGTGDEICKTWMSDGKCCGERQGRGGSRRAVAILMK